jgi:PAB1-binding protein PBP1
MKTDLSARQGDPRGEPRRLTEKESADPFPGERPLRGLVGMADNQRDLGTHFEPHYSLAEAAERFFPRSRITGRSLRTEIDKGFLPRKKIAGKLVISATDIARMLELKSCNEQKVRASTSGQRMAPAAQSGLSKTDRIATARAAALMTSKERDKLSRTT